VSLGVLVVVGSLLSAAAVGYLGYRWSQVTKYDVKLKAAVAGEPANYLLVGSDSRENIDPDDPDAGGFLADGEVGGERSDTIMVLRVDPQEQAAQLLSFPRDLWLPIADDHGTDRINAAYGYGRQVLIDTIEQNFDLTINHYVEIDFVAFRDVVDHVGGVPLWFDQPVRDDHTGLLIETPGCHVLDGSQALYFARSRYLEYQTPSGSWQTDPTADFGRITRQQIFIRRAVDKAVDQGFTNPGRLNRLLGSVLPKVGIDRSLDAGDLLDLAGHFRNFDTDQLVTHTLPTEDHRTSGGAAVQLLVEREAEPVLNVFRGLPPGALSPPFIQVEVRNGTGVEGQAAAAAAALAEIGFDVQGTDDHPGHVGRTTVLYGEGGGESARRLGLHLTGGAALVFDDELAESQLVLVTGDDFTTIHAQPAPIGSADEVATTSTTEAPPPGPAGDGGGAGDGGAGDGGSGDGGGGGGGQAPPETTTTTVLGYATGEPPPGEECG
jgi:polyisoprenyl-teichoic acid--peptidoglycan teichoic acid transferase